MNTNFIKSLEKKLPKPINECSYDDIYYALLATTKEYITTETKPISGDKKVYYISAEFLIGKLLSNNLINLQVYDEVSNFLTANGLEMSKVEEVEPEPSLGNGGLGRLASCFIDSIATLDLPGDGIGLNYHFGLFKQVFENNLQKETKNEWIKDDSWLRKTDVTYDIQLADKVVKSRMYEIDVVGFNQGYNKLKLFDIESLDESIVKSGINFEKSDFEKNLTLFLYPDDSDRAGHLLRIYQQYFMVSNGARIILDEVKAKGFDIRNLDQHAVIQINDTHPTLVIPELIRLLMEEGFTFDEALATCQKTCAYTNHTILAEALEKWPLEYLQEVTPQLIDIILKLNDIIKEKYEDANLQIIDQDGRVHMAHICIHFGFSTNGVAALHTEILKSSELNHFYKIYPEKFNNKTNGITFRRWLLHSNHELSAYLEQLLGDSFKYDANQLEKLLAFKDDSAVLAQLKNIKLQKKEQLASYISEHEGIEIDPNSIYDIQIKRLHEYKRQQMNALYVIHKYLSIKNGEVPARPITFIFGAKAAPAYTIAKDIIHLLLSLSQLIENDAEVNKHIKLVFVENYNVTYGEKLFPAADISEQISLASKEASGTGNMKFMLNGAITLGTNDGANVEIADLVGEDNIYIFGKESEEIIQMYEDASYSSRDIYEGNEHVKQLVDFIVSDQLLAVGNSESLNRLYNEILSKDWFMTLIDIIDYIDVKEKCLADYEDAEKWGKMALVNIAKAGFFSSDRTIADYNQDIWKLK